MNIDHTITKHYWIFFQLNPLGENVGCQRSGDPGQRSADEDYPGTELAAYQPPGKESTPAASSSSSAHQPSGSSSTTYQPPGRGVNTSCFILIINLSTSSQGVNFGCFILLNHSPFR
jgi:hypothetical protein